MVYPLTPPKTVEGMTILNRDAFTSNYEVPCLYLDATFDHSVMKSVKNYLLKLRQFKSVKNDGNRVIVYLDPQKVEKFDDINEEDRNIISKFTTHIDKTTLTLNYNHWQPEQIFKAIFSNEKDLPSSFTKVGHILHLNLRESQLPYKKLIGQVYLDKVPQTQTVVNKLNNIETKFRYFEMEILAGSDNTITTVKENNCSFTFDFAKVYWNSRLTTEHANLLKFMNKDDVLYDVFAGVGPFAIPASRKGVNVLANDLNPESFKWLQSNALANKTKSVKCYNKDGRDFLKTDVREHILSRRHSNASGVEHIAMNLPAIAHEFLDVFHNWMNDDEIIQVCKNPPLIHLYCFVKVSKTDDPKSAAQSLVESTLGCKLSNDSLNIIHYVRNVAPNKEMMRVSFYLTENIMKFSEPIMGKNKKISKTKNVFKVPTKSSTFKAKTQNKNNITKKNNKNNMKKKSQDKIKAIDQQLMTLRNKVSCGKIANKSEKKNSKDQTKTEPLLKTKSQPKMNPDIMQRLKI
ncbi:hypothetical protein PV325_009341 [Microctonus aethiopoides]|nr:hypothetical protein PV325_009341 [Microctonus aethiopoides]